MDDWSREPAGERWIKQVMEEMVPPMQESAMIMSLVPERDGGDVKFWVELGASIMLEKPIIAVVLSDRPIPPKLEQIADEVVYVPDGVDLGASEELGEALERVRTRLEAES